jgi:hypothetical protein
MRALRGSTWIAPIAGSAVGVVICKIALNDPSAVVSGLIIGLTTTVAVLRAELGRRPPRAHPSE